MTAGGKSMERSVSYMQAVPYVPPEFASRIQEHAPRTRMEFAMKPTPIQEWKVKGLPEGIHLSIKRDDMTASTAGGNKIRKLEFLFADALGRGCDTVITAGGVQSNHARATAVLARELGLDAHVFLRSKNPSEPERLGFDGNVLLHKLVGSHVHLVKPQPYLKGLLPKMENLQNKLEEEKGKRSYIIGIGGSNPIGLWGYIDCFEELMKQSVHENFTDIVVPVGSGGTASGLAIGNYLAGSPLRIHAVSVCDNAQYFHNHLEEMLSALGLDGSARATDILHIIEAKGRGYAKSTETELKFCAAIAKQTGIVLDRVYTGKAAKGLLDYLNLQTEGSRFAKDARILFVHTGGVFGIFDREIESQLQDSVVEAWPE